MERGDSRPMWVGDGLAEIPENRLSRCPVTTGTGIFEAIFTWSLL